MRVRSRQSSKQLRSYKIAAVALLLVFFGMLVPRLISAVSELVMSPFYAVDVWLEESGGAIPTFVRGRESLADEIKDLKNSLALANRTSLTQQRLYEENNRLRQLLDIGGESRIAAAIVARPDELPYDLLQIDRGSEHGIEVGAPVFIGKDVVIGLVVHIASNYSFVELITTPDFKASAFISGPDVVVTMEGMGGGVARVKVPQGVPLAIGNLVYLPSVEPGVFGRISYLENEPTQPEQFGYITPDVSLASLYQVSVGKLSQITRSAEEIDERILEDMRMQLLVEDITVGKLEVLETASSSEEGESSDETSVP